MTRNVEMRRIAFAKSSRTNNTKIILGSTFSAMKNFYNRTQNTKRAISSAVVEASEILADRTARKGLFGEDAGCGFCGTDAGYIPENAIELKYINLDMTGFDNAYTSTSGAAVSRNAHSAKNGGVLKCFNGF